MLLLPNLPADGEIYTMVEAAHSRMLVSRAAMFRRSGDGLRKAITFMFDMLQLVVRIENSMSVVNLDDKLKHVGH